MALWPLGLHLSGTRAEKFSNQWSKGCKVSFCQSEVVQLILWYFNSLDCSASLLRWLWTRRVCAFNQKSFIVIQVFYLYFQPFPIFRQQPTSCSSFSCPLRSSYFSTNSVTCFSLLLLNSSFSPAFILSLFIRFSPWADSAFFCRQSFRTLDFLFFGLGN